MFRFRAASPFFSFSTRLSSASISTGDEGKKNLRAIDEELERETRSYEI